MGEGDEGGKSEGRRSESGKRKSSEGGKEEVVLGGMVVVSWTYKCLSDHKC